MSKQKSSTRSWGSLVSDQGHVLSFAVKVPLITLEFWVIKILSTGMGETAADYFDKRFNPIYSVLTAGVILTFSLWKQFKAPTYQPKTYWFAVVMVSVFGTMVADALHVALGVPYSISTPLFVAAVGILLAWWYRVEGSLSIHTIVTPRRELFYWATVMATFALGTAAGDLTAMSLNLGFFWSGVMFAVAFAIPVLAYKFFNMNEVFAFWMAYIITRPFGASFADWMGVSKERGGLAFGTGPVSIVLAIIIVLLVSRASSNESLEQTA